LALAEGLAGNADWGARLTAMAAELETWVLAQAAAPPQPAAVAPAPAAAETVAASHAVAARRVIAAPDGAAAPAAGAVPGLHPPADAAAVLDPAPAVLDRAAAVEPEPAQQPIPRPPDPR